MKKFLMFSLTVAAMCFAAQAGNSYIYWLLGDPSQSGMEGGDWDYAKIAVRSSQDGSFTSYLLMGDSVSDKAYYDSADPTEIGPSFANLGGYGSDEYSFLIELYLESTGEMIGVNGQSVSYAELLANDSIAGSMIGGGNAFDFSTLGYSVPEPTSGLMLLVGMAALALRRRRVQA